jgi:MiaB-like tRNA modifying enzyme
MNVYIKTFGCSSNIADSAAIGVILKRAGFRLVYNLGEADAVIVNTCTVRKETELKVLRFLGKVQVEKVVVTGCMAEVQPALISKAKPNASIISPHNLASIPSSLTKSSRSVIMAHSQDQPEPAPFKNGVKYTVAISRGCLGRCSYCIVRLARGNLKSLQPQRVVDLISRAVKRGAREIRVSAQDTCTYGRDLSTDLPSLLDRVTKIDGDFKVRVGMFNPSSAKDILDRLICSFQSEKIYKFAHIPVQSGSDRVLDAMNRRYSVESFSSQLQLLRSSFHNLSFFTDIIVGLPGESEEDFLETVELIREIRPDKTHIARFSPRPHTLAASLAQVPENLKKLRSEYLCEVAQEIQMSINQKWIGRQVDATIVDRYLKGGMIGRTKEYKTVAIDGCDVSMLGRSTTLSIESCTPFYLKGSIIRR